MNIIERIENAKVQIAALKAAMEGFRNEFSQFIVDKSVPLDERWQVWLDAPDDLKGEQSWIVHFKSLPDDFVGYDCHVYAERHQTVYITEIVERIEEMQDELAGEPPAENAASWEKRYYESAKKAMEDFDFDVFREEILEMNIHSFEYDW